MITFTHFLTIMSMYIIGFVSGMLAHDSLVKPEVQPVQIMGETEHDVKIRESLACAKGALQASAFIAGERLNPPTCDYTKDAYEEE